MDFDSKLFSAILYLGTASLIVLGGLCAGVVLAFVAALVWVAFGLSPIIGTLAIVVIVLGAVQGWRASA